MTINETFGYFLKMLPRCAGIISISIPAVIVGSLFLGNYWKNPIASFLATDANVISVTGIFLSLMALCARHWLLGLIGLIFNLAIITCLVFCIS